MSIVEDPGRDALAGLGSSQNGPGPAEEAAALTFYTADDLLADAPEEPEWVWDGLVAAGLIALLAGRPKRAGGKSSLAWGLVRAVVLGHESFCGRRLAGGAAVYLTEEPGTMLRPKVAPLAGNPRLSLVWREKVPRPRPPWAVSIADAVAECHRIGARLLVIDTFAEWARMAAESEQDAGAVQAAMEALAAAAASGLAVVLIHHMRKGSSGESDGEDVRGSSALIAAVNVIVEISRVKDGPSRQRVLNVSSHWPRSPESMIVELLPDDLTYTLVSEGEREEVRGEAKRRSQRQRLAFLPSVPPGATTTEARAELGLSDSGARKVLNDAQALGVVERVKGGEGRSDRWWRVPEVPE